MLIAWDNGITIFDAFATCGNTLTEHVTPVRFGGSRFMIEDDWERIRREMIGGVIGLNNYYSYTTVEGGLSEI